MFYPLSKITPSLHTSGSEFFLKETQKDYKGSYYSTYDGKFFTEKTPSSNSKELIKYSKLSTRSENSVSSLYNKITNTGKSSPKYIKAFTVLPTEADYANGFIQRYYTRRVNGDASSIKEVNKEDFNTVKTNPLYTQVEVTWIITGVLEDTILAQGIISHGVVTKNYQTILAAEKQIPQLLSVVQDFSEFSK